MPVASRPATSCRRNARGRAATLAACALTAALSACAVSGPSSTPPAEPIVTHAIPAHLERDGLERGDVEALKRGVAAAPEGRTDVAWANETSGASGSITQVASFEARDGRRCRRFSTTIQNFMGVSIFEGETCRVRGTTWILSKLRKR